MAIHPSKALLRINHLLAETDAVYHQMSSKLGLADSTMHILYTLLNAGSQCSLKVIRQLSGLPKQTLHSAISKLEDNGYVILLTEGRSKCARLTESGLALAEATAGRIIAAEDRVYATWTPAELAAYLTLTERYLADLRRECDSLQE